MRMLGLDIGSRRIGVAVSDASGRLASPLTTVDVVSTSEAAAELVALAERESATGFVCGLPFELSGREGYAVRRTTRMIDALRAVTDLPVETVDERLSSAQAGRELRDNGISGRKNQRPVIDQAAAAIILQAWLDARAER